MRPQNKNPLKNEIEKLNKNSWKVKKQKNKGLYINCRIFNILENEKNNCLKRLIWNPETTKIWYTPRFTNIFRNSLASTGVSARKIIGMSFLE